MERGREEEKEGKQIGPNNCLAVTWKVRGSEGREGDK